MKRIVAFLATLTAAGAMAQAPFTIVRPADGAKVREVVEIAMPKDSIPSDAFIGVFINGRFIEGTIPDVKGNYYVYPLDTKARAIADGTHTIEIKLYQQVNRQPVIVETSSIEVSVQNSATIPVPADGFRLRYAWRPDRTYTYSVDNTVSYTSIEEEQNRLGARASEQELEQQKFRMTYSVDNLYPDGNALIRMSAAPLPGKKNVFLSTLQNPDGRAYDESELASIYMQLNSLGRQLWGAVPAYWPFEGTSGVGSTTNLFANFPMPVLPSNTVRPGDAWPSRFQFGQLDLNNLYGTNNLVQVFPARGEFLGVEWERGFPCAKIKHSVEIGARPERQPGSDDKEPANEFDGQRLKVDETFWFALDIGLVVRLDRELSVDMASVQQSAGGPPAGGVGGPPAGLNIPGGVPGGFRGRDDSERQARGGFQGGPPGAGGPPGMGGPPAGAIPGGVRGGPPFQGGPPGGFPGMGRGAGRPGAPTGTNATLNRLKVKQRFLLER